MTNVLRAPQSTSCLAVVKGVVDLGRVERLRLSYAPVLPSSASQCVVPALDGRAGVVLVGAGWGETDAPTDIAWGCPVGATGDATDGEIDAVLTDPARHGPSMAGVYVLVRVSTDSIRMVTSASMPHTMRHVGGEGVDAWATRAVAACALAGRRAEIDERFVAEQVVFDYVLGSEELIAGARICEEATVLDITPSGVDERSWWSRAERLAAMDQPTDDLALRRAVGSVAVPFARVAQAELALTAGRDSRLVLETIASAGERVPTLTMGWPGYPDVTGAAHLARSAGFEHRLVTAGEPWPGTPLEVLMRMAIWNEGMEPPANYLSGRPDFRTPGTRLITGHGGEIGREMWRKATPEDLRDPGWLLMKKDKWEVAPPELATAALERVDAGLQGFHQPGRTPTEVLDRFHVTNRMRAWTGRLLPDRSPAAFLPVYLEPAVVRVLLSLPPEMRSGAAAFAPSAQRGPLGLLGGRVARVARRELTRLRRRSEAPRLSDEVQLLTGLVAELREASLTRQVLGDPWVQQAMARCGTDVRWRHVLWNAVGVDVAALALRDVAG